MTISRQSTFRFLRHGPAASLAIALALAGALSVLYPASGARAQIFVGGSGKPGVSVDMNLVKELGPAPSVADVLHPRYGRPAPARLAAPVYKPKFPDIRAMGRTPKFGRVVLRPPGSKPARAAKRPRRKAQPVTPKRRIRHAAVTPKPAPVKRPRAAPAPRISAPPKPAPRAAPIVATPAPAPKQPARKAPTVVTRKPIPAPPPALIEKPVQAAKIPLPPVAAKLPAPAVTPAPLPAVKPKPAKQTASLPPAGDRIMPGSSIRLIFPAGSVKLSANARARLDAVAKAMAKNDNYRLQLLAYASGSSKTASRARRMSLSRALAARLRLIDKGVRSTRIDVRALGNKSKGGPPDRIDLMVSAR